VTPSGRTTLALASSVSAAPRSLPLTWHALLCQRHPQRMVCACNRLNVFWVRAVAGAIPNGCCAQLLADRNHGCTAVRCMQLLPDYVRGVMPFGWSSRYMRIGAVFPFQA
jgi:hypothetical protein